MEGKLWTEFYSREQLKIQRPVLGPVCRGSRENLWLPAGKFSDLFSAVKMGSRSYQGENCYYYAPSVSLFSWNTAIQIQF